MMYSEFAEAVGCRDNAHNHEVFRRLEIIYMTDDSITKDEIYDMGRKLVDNSKTEAEKELEKELNAKKADYKREITYLREEIEQYKRLLKGETDREWIRDWKRSIQWRRDTIKEYKNRIAEIDWILGR